MDKLIFKLFYSKTAYGLFFAVIIIFLAGCDSKITGKATEQIPKETAKNPEAYFCPGYDCSKVLEKNIQSANFSVHCAFYDINLKNVISSLSQKSKNADVRLVVEKSNYKEQIKGDGIRLDNNEFLMHNKFCVIDDRVVITGSFNPTDNDNNYNNNNVLVVYSSILAKNYDDEFNELWNGKFGGGNNVKHPALYVNNIRIENYFCPEDECSSHMIDLIKNAKSSIYFMSFSFTSEGIADALIMKNNLEMSETKKVSEHAQKSSIFDIKGIFDSSQSAGKFSQFKRLQSFGLNVKKDTNKYKMHHKVFIIDNETVATGSFNPTLSADTKNDENLLIIHDKKIAGAFLNEFDNLWQ